MFGRPAVAPIDSRPLVTPTGSRGSGSCCRHADGGVWQGPVARGRSMAALATDLHGRTAALLKGDLESFLARVQD